MSGIVACWVAIVLLGWPFLADGKEKLRSERQQLDDYLQRVRQSTTEAAPSTGSLWTPEGTFANLAIDYKTRYVNDLITIRITEQTRAEGNGSVQSQRTFEANSGISALFGLVGGRSGLRSLFSPGSERGLNGQVQTSSNTVLQTRLTGHVVEVLPNGYLVIKAVRAVKMNNERETLVLRGVIRPGDIAPDNSVPSTAISHLEVKLVGKGVISAGVRRWTEFCNSYSECWDSEGRQS